MKFAPKELHLGIFYNKDLGTVMQVWKYVAWSKWSIEIDQAKSRVIR